jgi:uncharacterized membrane protein
MDSFSDLPGWLKSIFIGCIVFLLYIFGSVFVTLVQTKAGAISQSDTLKIAAQVVREGREEQPRLSLSANNRRALAVTIENVYTKSITATLGVQVVPGIKFTPADERQAIAREGREVIRSDMRMRSGETRTVDFPFELTKEADKGRYIFYVYANAENGQRVTYDVPIDVGE